MNAKLYHFPAMMYKNHKIVFKKDESGKYHFKVNTLLISTLTGVEETHQKAIEKAREMIDRATRKKLNGPSAS